MKDSGLKDFFIYFSSSLDIRCPSSACGACLNNEVLSKQTASKAHKTNLNLRPHDVP